MQIYWKQMANVSNTKGLSIRYLSRVNNLVCKNEEYIVLYKMTPKLLEMFLKSHMISSLVSLNFTFITKFRIELLKIEVWMFWTQIRCNNVACVFFWYELFKSKCIQLFSKNCSICFVSENGL